MCTSFADLETNANNQACCHFDQSPPQKTRVCNKLVLSLCEVRVVKSIYSPTHLHSACNKILQIKDFCSLIFYTFISPSFASHNSLVSKTWGEGKRERERNIPVSGIEESDAIVLWLTYARCFTAFKKSDFGTRSSICVLLVNRQNGSVNYSGSNTQTCIFLNLSNAILKKYIQQWGTVSSFKHKHPYLISHNTLSGSVSFHSLWFCYARAYSYARTKSSEWEKVKLEIILGWGKWCSPFIVSMFYNEDTSLKQWCILQQFPGEPWILFGEIHEYVH